MRRVVRWIEERIPVDHEIVRKGLREPLPVHMKSWIFCLGGTPAMLFCILAVTGILLTFYYVPSPAQAYASVSNITFKVRMGWFVRGITSRSIPVDDRDRALAHDPRLLHPCLS